MREEERESAEAVLRLGELLLREPEIVAWLGLDDADDEERR